MFRTKTTLWKLGLASLLMLGVRPALSDPPPGAWRLPPPSPADSGNGSSPRQPAAVAAAFPLQRGLAAARPGRPHVQRPSPRLGGRAGSSRRSYRCCLLRRLSSGRSQSTWYFRQEAFYWNERSDGRDFVNEYGPLSTVGYLHRNGFERFRMELFGGTMAYDGGAQYDDGSGNEVYEPYHQSNGTNYLGVRGEYDLLIEPACWSRVRAVVGVGTRFWIRDLHDAVTPSGDEVYGYQEDWWTFYPYIGLETKESDEPGWQFFASARFGLTPLTYQYATGFRYRALSPMRHHRQDGTRRAIPAVLGLRVYRSHDLGRIGGRGGLVPAGIADAHRRRPTRLHVLNRRVWWDRHSVCQLCRCFLGRQECLPHCIRLGGLFVQ